MNGSAAALVNLIIYAAILASYVVARLVRARKDRRPAVNEVAAQA